jgi:hypothetical protein
LISGSCYPSKRDYFGTVRAYLSPKTVDFCGDPGRQQYCSVLLDRKAEYAPYPADQFRRYGAAATLCTWPRSITAITNRNKVTNWSLDDTNRNIVVSIAAGVLKCRIDIGWLIPEVAARPDCGSWKPKGHMSVIRALAVSVPRTKGSQIRVRHEPKKIAQFGDVQSAILIPVGHLEFSFEKAQ